MRLALGARSRDVRLMILREGGVLAAIGLITGVGGALLAGRALAGFLYGVTPRDPLVFGSVPLLFGAVALLASAIPARRASRVGPLTAIRSE